MGQTQAQIDADIPSKVLTGGSRTRAIGLRELLSDISGGYLNKKDGGVIEAVVSYSTEIALSDRKMFAHVAYVQDAITAIGGIYFPLSPTANVNANFAGAYNANFNNVLGVAFNGSTGGNFVVDMFDNVNITGPSAGNININGYNVFGVTTIGNSNITSLTGSVRVTSAVGFIINNGGYDASIRADLLVANNTYQMPSASGTLALLSQIPTNAWQNGGNAFAAGATIGTTGSNNWGLTRGGVEYVSFINNGILLKNSFGQANTGAFFYTQTVGRVAISPDNFSTAGGCNVNVFGTLGGSPLGIPYLDGAFSIRQNIIGTPYGSTDTFFVDGTGRALFGNSLFESPLAKVDIHCFTDSDANLGFRVANFSGVSLFEIGEGGSVRVGLQMRHGLQSVDPTAVNGLEYYNTTTNKLRIAENGIWKNIRTEYTEEITALITPLLASTWTLTTVTGAPANATVDIMVQVTANAGRTMGVRAAGSVIARLVGVVGSASANGSVIVRVKTNALSQVELFTNVTASSAFFYMGTLN